MSETTLPTRFDSTLDLARLPWFEVRGGNRLVMTDDALAEVGPIIDMHTHLAMGFLRRLRVDLHAETRPRRTTCRSRCRSTWTRIPTPTSTGPRCSP